MPGVPRILIRIWLGWKTYDPPPEYQETLDICTELMPEYNHILARDEDVENLIQRHYPAYYELWERLPVGIMRADMARYLYLHRYGGIYHDLDMVPERSVNEIMPLMSKDGVYLLKSLNCYGTTYTNAFLASSPRHPFWLDVIDEIGYRLDNPSFTSWEPHLKVFNTTGPNMITDVAQKFDITVLENKGVYDYSTCDSYYHKEIADRVQPYYKPHSLFRPIPGMTWANSWGKNCMWIKCNWKYIFIVLALLVLFIIFIYVLYSRITRVNKAETDRKVTINITDPSTVRISDNAWNI